MEIQDRPSHRVPTAHSHHFRTPSSNLSTLQSSFQALLKAYPKTVDLVNCQGDSDPLTKSYETSGFATLIKFNVAMMFLVRIAVAWNYGRGKSGEHFVLGDLWIVCPCDFRATRGQVCYHYVKWEAPRTVIRIFKRLCRSCCAATTHDTSAPRFARWQYKILRDDTVSSRTAKIYSVHSPRSDPIYCRPRHFVPTARCRTQITPIHAAMIFSTGIVYRDQMLSPMPIAHQAITTLGMSCPQAEANSDSSAAFHPRIHPYSVLLLSYLRLERRASESSSPSPCRKPVSILYYETNTAALCWRKNPGGPSASYRACTSCRLRS